MEARFTRLFIARTEEIVFRVGGWVRQELFKLMVYVGALGLILKREYV